jgi:cell wall-associated NlpC family hydrolase
MIAFVVLGLTVAGLVTPAAANAATSQDRAVIATLRMRLTVWKYALAQRGKPYIWGAAGPAGFDCSGLVYAAYRAAGILLPRTTYEMLGSWRLVRIPKWQARQGDLAFFGTGHVEIYDYGPWTLGALHTGTLVGFHRMNAYWHPTMYFRIRLYKRYATQ